MGHEPLGMGADVSEDAMIPLWVAQLVNELGQWIILILLVILVLGKVEPPREGK